MSEREKTYVEDVNRSIYDIRNEEKDVYRIKKGLTPDIVAEISEKKKDPAWMANFRLQSLQIYNRRQRQMCIRDSCRSIMRWKSPTGVPLLRV